MQGAIQAAAAREREIRPEWVAGQSHPLNAERIGVLDQDAKHGRMQMNVQMAVDVIERQAGGAKTPELRVYFPPQLFAQAVERYRSGEHWWPDISFEAQYIKAQQDARFEGDPWEERIAEFIELRTRVSVSEVATAALGFDGVSRVGTADQRRISNVLLGLGWKPGRDKRSRFYARG